MPGRPFNMRRLPRTRKIMRGTYGLTGRLESILFACIVTMPIDGLSKFTPTYDADIESDPERGRDPRRTQDTVTASAQSRLPGPLGGLSARDSSRTSGAARFAPVNGDVESGSFRRRQRITSGRLVESGASLFDAAASGLSLACSRLSATPVAQQATGAASGALWAVGAGVNQIANRPHSYGRSGVNLLGATAGILSTAGSFIPGKTGTGVAYGSAASWASNGAATIMRAAIQTGNHTGSRILHGASGTANIAAAALAAAAAKAAGENDETTAAKFGTASSVLWAVGALATLGAASTAGRETPGNADEINPGRKADDPPAA